jgi:hypothetical protein
MWPHAGDPQHGSFIQKHVKALADHQDIKQSVIVFADLDVHTTWHGVQVQSVKAALDGNIGKEISLVWAGC